MKRIWMKEARLANFMSQEAVARALGVSYAAVRKWESGASQPYPRHQKALSDLLGVDVHGLLQDEDKVAS